MKKKFKTVQILFDSQLTGLIQNEQNTAISWHFTKPAEYIRTNMWNYFQRVCMDKWRSGVFSLQTWCISLEAFASKKNRRIEFNAFDLQKKRVGFLELGMGIVKI